MTETRPTKEPEYCEWCGDELCWPSGNHHGTGTRHVNVKACVALCRECGGLRPTDERWEKREEDRCVCTTD